MAVIMQFTPPENVNIYGKATNMFDIGETVVCIDASPTTIDGRCDLVLGKHYVVAWIGMFEIPGHDDMLTVHLEGVKRSPHHQFLALVVEFEPSGLPWPYKHTIEEIMNAPFRATRFAPLRKTDIGVLERLLVPIKTKVPEDA